MEVIVKTRKLGGSIIATIPNDAAKALNLKENEFIELDIKKRKKSFFGIMKSVSGFTEKDRFDRK